MKKTLLLLAFAAFSQLAIAQSEELGILETVNDYLEGGTNGNVEQFKRAFLSSAIQRSVSQNGKLIGMSVEALASKITPGQKMSRQTSVISWTYAGIAATAITETAYPSSKIIDLLNLVKVDGQWKIVSRVYSRIEKSESVLSSNPIALKASNDNSAEIKTVIGDGW